MPRYSHDDGRIEVTASREGRRLELYLDPATGQVIELESYGRRGDGPRRGLDDAAIREQLAAQGYEVRRYEREHGRIEVYAVRDGRHLELEVDPHSGRVLREERE